MFIFLYCNVSFLLSLHPTCQQFDMHRLLGPGGPPRLVDMPQLEYVTKGLRKTDRFCVHFSIMCYTPGSMQRVLVRTSVRKEENKHKSPTHLKNGVQISTFGGSVGDVWKGMRAFIHTCGGHYNSDTFSFA